MSPFSPVESQGALSKALICGTKSLPVRVALKPEATDTTMQPSVSPSGEQVPTGRNGPGPQTVVVKLLLESLFPAEQTIALGANISLEES